MVPLQPVHQTGAPIPHRHPQFAAKVVPVGRTFLCRMIDLSTLAAHLHEHNTLNGGFSLDIQWWTAFTTPWSGCSFFLLPNWTLTPELELYTDSSGTIGYGTYCK